MAICDICKREMKKAVSCSSRKLLFEPFGRAGGGVDLAKIPFGNETRFGGPDDGPVKCHDCGISLFGYHHAGCDWEECPRCHGQLISCACNEAGLFSDVLEVQR